MLETDGFLQSLQKNAQIAHTLEYIYLPLLPIHIVLKTYDRPTIPHSTFGTRQNSLKLRLELSCCSSPGVILCATLHM